MEDRITNCETEIVLIKERNSRVEEEKAWEISYFRIGIIMGMTYFTATVALLAIGNEYPFRNALIPMIGYVLSTQSVPFMKQRWLRHRS